ncbi:hypothetical protein D3C77_422330 [compost metagenome]
MLIHCHHGGIAAAPDDVGVLGHVLHRAILPGRLRLELLLETDGDPGLPRAYLQRREGMTIPRGASLIVITTAQQRQGRQSYHQALSQLHCHSFLSHSLARTTQGEPGPLVAAAVFTWRGVEQRGLSSSTESHGRYRLR